MKLVNVKDDYDDSIFCTIIFKDGFEIMAKELQKEVDKIRNDDDWTDNYSYYDLLELLITKYDDTIEHIINVNDEDIDTIWF